MAAKNLKCFSSVMLFVLLFLLTGCRDYISDPEINMPPVLSTDKQTYVMSDTATVTLFNPSASIIYVTVVYNSVEIKNNSEWFIYSIVACGGGCPEFAVAKGQTVSTRNRVAANPGTYRLVCYYGKKPNTPFDEKYRIYSMEFTVN